jgi:hypothetical protein
MDNSPPANAGPPSNSTQQGISSDDARQSAQNAANGAAGNASNVTATSGGRRSEDQTGAIAQLGATQASDVSANSKTSKNNGTGANNANDAGIMDMFIIDNLTDEASGAAQKDRDFEKKLADQQAKAQRSYQHNQSQSTMPYLTIPGLIPPPFSPFSTPTSPTSLTTQPQNLTSSPSPSTVSPEPTPELTPSASASPAASPPPPPPKQPPPDDMDGFRTFNRSQ